MPQSKEEINTIIQEKLEIITDSKTYLNIKEILEISLRILNERKVSLSTDKITSFFQSVHNNEIDLLFSFKNGDEESFKKLAVFISWLHSYISYIDIYARFKLIFFFVVSFIVIEEYEKQKKSNINQNILENSNIQAFFIDRFSKYNRSLDLYDIKKIIKEEVVDIVYCFREWIYLDR